MPDRTPNPFSSQFTTPQNCRFVALPVAAGSSDDTDLQLKRWRQQILANNVTQIVGPHGCGKSTLANVLVSNIAGNFRSLHSVILRREDRILSRASANWSFDGQFGLPDVTANSSQPKLILIDGIETFGFVHGRLLIKYLVSKNFTVIITTHRRMLGVKVLVKLAPSHEHFWSIVQTIQQHAEPTVTRVAAEQAFVNCNGNYREAMWLLYDHWQDMQDSAAANQLAEHVAN